GFLIGLTYHAWKSKSGLLRLCDGGTLHGHRAWGELRLLRLVVSASPVVCPGTGAANLPNNISGRGRGQSHRHSLVSIQTSPACYRETVPQSLTKEKNHAWNLE